MAARVFLTLGALFPYWRLLSFQVVFVTDDFFASDIFNGELPGRVLVGQMIRHGQWPAWTSALCSGLPLAGAPMDPIGLAAFALLPPAPALDLLVIVLLLIAAHGAYGLARRFGADRPGAVLAGVAFAGSGYVACQLKHLSIVSTVVWLPVGMALLDRALRADPDPASMPRRVMWMAAFGLVFAEQALCGFPQSAYICGLVYAAFAVFLAAIERRRAGAWRAPAQMLAGTGVAALLGAAAGAIVLLPLSALGDISDRAEGLSWDWSTRLAYWVPNAWTFLFPYANGDISNATYKGPPFFWEDYGYVGLATFLLAIYGGIRERRRPVAAFTILLTLVAYACVLGRATPVFHVLYLIVPGMKLFRFPTRFLIVVELGLAVLAALGLARLRKDIERAWPPPSHVALIVTAGICAVTMLDLFVHQPRQNPMVPAQNWLAAPASVAVVHADTPQPRTFTPRHRDMHRVAFTVAQGWKNVTPYFEMRDVLEPNTGAAFWNTPSADCYAGVAARWYVDVWGDHNREASIAGLLTALDVRRATLVARPVLANVLRTFGVTHVLSVYPQSGTALVPISHTGEAWIYRVDGAARVRFVSGARLVSDDREAILRLIDPDFNPDREILLHDAPPSIGPVAGAAAGTPAGTAVIATDDADRMVIEATAPQDGFLLVADTFYPGWTAEIDGRPAPLYRANVSVRGIPLAKGRHTVRLTYEAPGLRAGALVSAAALLALLGMLAGSAFMAPARPKSS